MPEMVLDMEKAYTGRLLSLVRYRVSINGVETIREVVEHPGAVVIIPIKDDGKIVLVRQYRLPARETLIEAPAGTLNEGEGEEECARRELLEETGYEAESLKMVRRFYLAPGYSTEKITLFIARGLNKKSQSPEPDEDVEVLEVTVEEALRMVRDGTIKDAKTIVGIYDLISGL
ncbi:MAG: NUDIX hydrolase [Thermoproteota archaeon]|nr:NUDIX hydrolase [Candidatus Brockarchaeota archaeon]